MTDNQITALKELRFHKTTVPGQYVHKSNNLYVYDSAESNKFTEEIIQVSFSIYPIRENKNEAALVIVELTELISKVYDIVNSKK